MLPSNLLKLPLLPRDLKVVFKSEFVRALNEKLPDIQLDDVESAVTHLERV